MMPPAGQPTISVVVVSRRRPEALKRALVGISQLRYPAFEVVVVADAAGLAAAKSLPFGDQLKTVEYETPNISAARNRGIAHAAGEIVAFVDDDAVPETGWLHHLAAPFAKPDVAAAGGYVRGRNGISFQWQAQSVDGTGAGLPLEIDGDDPVVLTPDGQRAIKTEGTNMAFRREVLAELGGFDPAFHYYLDETDLNLRLAAAGYKTAIVPRAEVHHGYAENQQRTAARVPRDLSEIGASKAVFLRKHCPEGQRDAVWKAFCQAQRRRLVAHMVAGHVVPGDVRRLLWGLQQGHADGLTRVLGQTPELTHAADGFSPLDVKAGPQVVMFGRFWRRKAILREAKQAAQDGKSPSVFIFSRTGLFHSVRFDPAGFWVQRGGLFGRSERRQSLFRIGGYGARLRLEFQRVAAQRLLSETLLPKRLQTKQQAQKRSRT
ncbi:glycosyltransferase family 2 protein [uncultured Shimia sp.]|uniref:glycosyltransferase family 2 protein n=1 Tax=uncultured Shimia sp. TaxID=573152 RepID=UPI0025D188E0|nr:glycosyltransferase family 2 protein [uncultured Shimia sp.]